MNLWTISTGHDFGGISTSYGYAYNNYQIILPLLDSNFESSIVQGQLPTNLSLVNNIISGMIDDESLDQNIPIMIQNGDGYYNYTLIFQKLNNPKYEVSYIMSDKMLTNDDVDWQTQTLQYPDYSITLPYIVPSESKNTILIEGKPSRELNEGDPPEDIIEIRLQKYLTLENNKLSGFLRNPEPVNDHYIKILETRTTGMHTYYLKYKVTQIPETKYKVTIAIQFQERRSVDILLPLSDNSYTTEIITGKLPTGLHLDKNRIIGTPFEVDHDITSKFTIRASHANQVSDKTFYMTITGADDPVWYTPAGLLPIGSSGSYFVLDETYVDFQLRVIDTDMAAGQTLDFWISSQDGALPPGLSLSKNGRIYGFVLPLLAKKQPATTGFYDTTPYDSYGFDQGSIDNISFGSYNYDVVPYDYFEKFSQPKKLNRNYEFIVSASDGHNVIKRKFNIYVIGDSVLLSDNTFNKVSSLTYTADLTKLRDPVWITNSDLGYRRANNYQTIKLDIYNTITDSLVLYSLDNHNPDGSISKLPSGLQLDSITSEIVGIIPYQPATTQEYIFTITALRVGKLRGLSLVDNPDTYPIRLNNTIVYRTTILENLFMVYVYTSQDYVQGHSGIKLYKPVSDSSWRYINEELEITYYSDNDSTYPWDIKTWYDSLDLVQLVTGPSLTVLPPDSTLYSENYETASTKRTFTLKVIGEIDSNITWVTDSNLGSLEVEMPSTLYVEAKTNINSIVKYQIIDGIMPPGLYMNSDGHIIGKINQFGIDKITTFDFTLDSDKTTIDRVYSFSVLASDISEKKQTIKEFTISITSPNTIQFSSICVQPMMPPELRSVYRTFISNSDIFEYSCIYRMGDPNFGIQSDMQMLVYGGIETKKMQDFMTLVDFNHKRKRFKFGDIKVAKAIIPGTHQIVYEVIYIEMKDPLENINGILPEVIYTSKENNPIRIDQEHVFIDQNDILISDEYQQLKRPSSIHIWRKRIKELGYSDRHYLPLWMRSIQDNTMVELDYVPAVVLCYCKPDCSNVIMLNISNFIKTNNFNFNQFDYDVDRYIINAVDHESDNTNKYIIFPNKRITLQ